MLAAVLHGQHSAQWGAPSTLLPVLGLQWGSASVPGPRLRCAAAPVWCGPHTANSAAGAAGEAARQLVIDWQRRLLTACTQWRGQWCGGVIAGRGRAGGPGTEGRGARPCGGVPVHLLLGPHWWQARNRVEALLLTVCCRREVVGAVCKLVITPWQEDNGYVPLANPETSRKAKPGE